MSESQSSNPVSASKLTTVRQITTKVAIGLGAVGLVLFGYAYGPGTSSSSTPADEPSARTAIVPAAVAQTSKASIESQIPLPVPANVAPLTKADVDRATATPATGTAAELIPLPQPADVPPLTAADIAAENTAAEKSDSKPQAVASVPATETRAPEAASAEPSASSTKPDAEAAPPLDAEAIKKLTGKDLVKAPLAANLAAADVAVAERLRELLAGRLDRYIDRRNERPGVEAFYRDRGFAPLWVENGARAKRTAAMIEFLQAADADGLDPSDYPVPSFSAAADAKTLAEAELRLTASVLAYARHASTGRVHFSRVSAEISYNLESPDPADVLAKMAAASDPAPALAAYQPQHPQYKALKEKLAEARKATGEKEIVRIPAGPTLKPGMEDPRVALLRKRLDISGDRDSPIYGQEVVEAVASFQKSAGLVADGLAGPATLRALNGPSRANRIDTIIVNLDRWRWMPRDLGSSHSILNIPDFTIRVVRNGKKVWETKTVVGRPSRQTPVMSDAMKFITVNPTWNVPPGIMANDYLPALRDDPTALERIGVRVEQNRDGTIRMYQPPGDNNALGRLRFNFPNKFLVYQHDTPDKHLFQRDVRAYSSGCMRVQDPVKYAEVMLSIALPNERYTQERIRAMFGPSEININFPKPIPVHITYQTAFVDDAGQLQLRDDVYGHDAAMIALLKGSERQVADIAIPRRHQTVSREELRLPNGVYLGAYDGPRYGSNPIEDFFRSIFR